MGGKLSPMGISQSIQGGMRKRQRQFSALAATPSLWSNLAVATEDAKKEAWNSLTSPSPSSSSTTTTKASTSSTEELQPASTTTSTTPSTRPLAKSYFSNKLTPFSLSSSLADDPNPLVKLSPRSKTQKQSPEVLKMMELVKIPNGSPQDYNIAWRHYRSLSTEDRHQLSGSLSHVLRKVVGREPDVDLIVSSGQEKLQRFRQRQLVRARKNTPSQQQDVFYSILNSSTEYPWTRRLQFVMRDMRALRKATPGDWLFVVEQIAHSGDLVVLEQVVREMIADGHKLSPKFQTLRVKALKQWLSKRSYAHSLMTRQHLSMITKRPHRLPLEPLPSIPVEIANLISQLFSTLDFDSWKIRQKREVLVDLLHMARETGQDDSFDMILRTGYGIDLRYPDLPPAWLGLTKEGKRDIVKKRKSEEAEGIATTIPKAGVSREELVEQIKADSVVAQPAMEGHALNMVLRRYGRKGDLWKMLQAFEVLSAPLDSNVEGFPLDQDSLLPLPVVPAVAVEGAVNGEAVSTDEASAVELEAVEEEPPISLYAETQKEERARRGMGSTTLGISELLIPWKTDNQPPSSSEDPSSSSKQPLEALLEVNKFLTPTYTPEEVRALVDSTPEIWSESPKHRSSSLLEVNASTYEVLIQSCRKLIHYDYEDKGHPDHLRIKGEAELLSFHFLRSAVREADARRNVLLRTWLSLNNLEKSKLEELRIVGYNLTDSRVIEAATKWKEAQVYRIDRQSPILVDKHLIDLFMPGSTLRKPIKYWNSWEKFVKSQWEKSTQEWAIYTGKPWAEEVDQAKDVATGEDTTVTASTIESTPDEQPQEIEPITPIPVPSSVLEITFPIPSKLTFRSPPFVSFDKDRHLKELQASILGMEKLLKTFDKRRIETWKQRIGKRGRDEERRKLEGEEVVEVTEAKVEKSGDWLKDVRDESAWATTTTTASNPA